MGGETDLSRQRVRVLIFLRHVQLRADQLQMLAGLRQLAAERSASIRDAEARFVARRDAAEGPIYEQLWEDLGSGQPLDSPELALLTERLAAARAEGPEEGGLLRIRMEGMRSILDAERPFLATLTPDQEALFTDALFLLRHRLDPVANPGDFRELVGTTYEPGQYAVLTRGTGELSLGQADIGALWSDRPGLEGRELHNARREVLVYLLLLEPGLDEAITAAQRLLAEG